MSLVSVIVPVYKVEDYLRKCVDSILAQTYKNLEIILVDDGSPDNCGAICDEYALLDGRVKVIHKENGGLSDARNAGLDVCTGEYIAFVDSDDWVDEDYIATFMEYAQPDTIVCCGYRRWNGENCIVNVVKEFYEANAVEVINIQQKQVLAAICGISNINPIMDAAWNKFYHRKLFYKYRYPFGKVYEDVFTCFDLFFKSKKVILIPKPTYNYIFRKDSICGNPTYKSICDLIEAYEKQEDDVKAYPDLLKNARKLTFCRYINFYSDCIKGFYDIDENRCKELKSYFKANDDMVSVGEWKVFIKYILILNCEPALKVLFKLWDIYKRLR